MNTKEVFAQQLKKYRKQKGYTQAALASLIPVSPQAVSKWEQGSMPDSELLPLIAEKLGVTIDSLFGLADTQTADPRDLMRNHISSYDEDERFPIAFQYQIDAAISTLGSSSLANMFSSMEGMDPVEGKDFIMQNHQRNGFSTGNITKNHTYFFSVCNLQEYYDEFFASKDKYGQILSVLADSTCLSILYFFFQHKPYTYFTTARISKVCHIEESVCLDKLYILEDNHLVTRSSYESEDGDVALWRPFNFLHLIAIFILLAGIVEGDDRGEDGITIRGTQLKDSDYNPFLSDNNQ